MASPFTLGKQPTGSATPKVARQVSRGAFGNKPSHGNDAYSQELMTPDMDTPGDPKMRGEPASEPGTQHPVFREEVQWPAWGPPRELAQATAPVARGDQVSHKPWTFKK